MDKISWTEKISRERERSDVRKRDRLSSEQWRVSEKYDYDPQCKRVVSLLSNAGFWEKKDFYKQQDK